MLGSTLFRTLMLGAVCLWLVVSIFRQPGEAFQAALDGLRVWWQIVFPGMLPFLVLAELLAAFGAVHLVARLVAPLIRSFFRLPPEAVPALVRGWLLGYTAGADAAVALVRDKQLSLRQGQRLLAFAHMPSPMLVLIVVGVGFMQQPALGFYLLATIWLSSLVLCWMPVAPPSRHFSANPFPPVGTRSISLSEAMLIGREQDGRSLGQALGESVAGAVQKLMLIGGFIMLCALLTALAEDALPAMLHGPLVPGLLEIHYGTYISIQSGIWETTVTSTAMVAFLLAWGGWSGLLQVKASFNDSGLRLLPLIGAKLLHGAAAFLCAHLLWPLYSIYFAPSFPALSKLQAGERPMKEISLVPETLTPLHTFWSGMPTAVPLLGLGIAVLFMLWTLSRRSSSL